jgi:hypothetical protein
MRVGLNTKTEWKMGLAVTRSVRNASSSLALSLQVAATKAGASSTHSKRFAPGNTRTEPQYVTGLTFQSIKRAQDCPPAAGAKLDAAQECCFSHVHPAWFVVNSGP